MAKKIRVPGTPLKKGFPKPKASKSRSKPSKDWFGAKNDAEHLAR